MAENKTGTDLQILKSIENAYVTAHGETAKRNTVKSLDWFRKYVTKNYSSVRTSQLARDSSLYKQNMMFGKMYSFHYDPKHKDKLPLYDTFPLVIPFGAYKAKNGDEIILGLNFHYLKPQHRMIAFKALLKFRNENRYRKSTKLELDWKVISALAESKYYKHAVHAYNEHHFRSLFTEIPAQSWELVLFLPTARFVKGSKQQAWRL